MDVPFPLDSDPPNNNVLAHPKDTIVFTKQLPIETAIEIQYKDMPDKTLFGESAFFVGQSTPKPIAASAVLDRVYQVWGPPTEDGPWGQTLKGTITVKASGS